MTDEVVNEICLREFSNLPNSVNRNLTGIAGYVYTIDINNEKYVIKVSDTKELISGSTYWLTKLARLELPIPKIYAINTQTCPYYFIMSFLPGKDLGLVYNSLSKETKRSIANEIYTYQNEILKLPTASGYGFLSSYEDKDNKRNSWKEVVENHIKRSENRIIQNGIFNKEYVNRVRSFIPHFDDYFNTIEPKPFFDDTTTKNVLIDNGKISGIIDLDWLCFGDRLYVIALTTMSLISMHTDLEYIESWKKLEKLNIAQDNVLLFYTLVFCIDFMSEKGMKFNKSESEVINQDEKAFLENAFEMYFRKLQLTTAST